MRSKISTTFLAVTMTLVSVVTGACEFHSAPNFGVFGGFQGPIQQHRSAPTKKELEVRHVKRLTTESGLETRVVVNYTLPLEYQAIIIEFIPSEHVSVVGEIAIEPTQIEGSHSLYFLASRAGEHEIEVNVLAQKNGAPYSSRQRIQINAI